MADDNNSGRYRPRDSFGRESAPAAPANDPLAELARLIGQTDPFSDHPREPRAPVPPALQDSGPHYTTDPIPSFLSNPAHRSAEPEPPPPPPHRSNPAPQYGHAAAPAARHSDQVQQQYGYHSAPRYSSEHPAQNDWPGSAPPAQPYPSREPFVQPTPQQHAPPQAAPHYDPQGHPNPNPNYAGHLHADPHGPLNYRPDVPGFDPPRYPAPPDRHGYAPPLYAHEPDAGGMPLPHDDEFYDDGPSGGRRKGLLTVVAVLGLAVIGTAGAFGYRSMFSSSGSSAPPPVIRASGEPSKVAPPPAMVDQSVSKFSYDRFGDAGKDEQVVRREEKPVDLTKVAPPRSVFPGVPAATAPSAKVGSGTTATANPPSAIGEPRRVRTVPIRPDQGPEAAAAQPPAQQPMSVAPLRQTSAIPNMPPPNPDNSMAARAAAPRPAPRAAVASAPPSAQSSGGNAPLSLSPEANNNPLPPPPAQDNFPPPRASAPPTRLASAPTSGGGSFLVQVSSQRSEADAQTAYRGIQSKYSSVLGNQPFTVRRADLGAKGVYYRAMVGPFASREEAVQVCVSLKQAGGDCVVQH